MLRTDYIPLRDTAKLRLLTEYYVDYYGFLNQILGENDQLIVGRRGTGKTTLLYRALVECMRSWKPDLTTAAKPRTLAIYVDLNKCQSIADIDSANFDEFEHVFVSELCDAITEEIGRSWPAINAESSFFSNLFRSAGEKQIAETKRLLGELAKVLRDGLPRMVDLSGRTETKDVVKAKKDGEVSATASMSEKPSLSAGAKAHSELATEQESKSGYAVSYRLTIADILRVLGACPSKARRRARNLRA